MIMELFVYIEEKGIDIAGMPVFICHETSPEDAMQAAEEGNAYIKVAVPVDITGESPDGIT